MPCEKPLSIRGLTHIDFTDRGDVELAWRKLLAALEGDRSDLSDPSHAVVRISIRSDAGIDFLGTGFVISPHHVVTCSHVLKRHPDDKLWISGMPWRGGGRGVTQRFTDGKRNFAVLEVDGSNEDVSADCILPLTARDPPASKANDTDVIGFVDAHSDVDIRPVPVIGYEGWSMTRVLQSSMAPGMSGSPAIHNGAVWGILQVPDIDKGLCYIIPPDAMPRWRTQPRQCTPRDHRPLRDRLCRGTDSRIRASVALRYALRRKTALEQDRAASSNRTATRWSSRSCGPKCATTG